MYYFLPHIKYGDMTGLKIACKLDILIHIEKQLNESTSYCHI